MTWARGKLVAALAALAALFALAGCGAATVKNDLMIEALNLSQVENATRYTVDGDPFCEVRSPLLNTVEMVQQAQKKKKTRKVLVTNPAGDAGVIGVTPFAGACRQRVIAGMQTVE